MKRAVGGVVVVGSVALDTVETSYGIHQEALGGAAVYFSLAARLFASPRMIGVVGTDFDARHVDLLRKNGVDVEGLQRVAGQSFRWAGRYSEDGNTAHTLDTQLGVFADFKPVVPERYHESPVLFLANIDPDLQLYVVRQMSDASKGPALIGGDTMNLWINTKRIRLLEMLKRIHLLFVNDQESRLLTGEHNLLKASEAILKLGPRAAVIKKGEHGSMIRSSDALLFCPPCPVPDVRDPTGAGDSFAGAFMGILAAARRTARTLDAGILSKACAYGSVVASFTVQAFGVKGLLDMKRTQIEQRLKKLRKLVRMP